MTPARFAEEASGLAATFGLEIEVWDETRLQQERCGALLAVARGSVHPPRLVTIKYQGADEADAPIAWSEKVLRLTPAATRSNPPMR